MRKTAKAQAVLSQAQAIAESITEKDWQDTLVDLAYANKCMVAHFRPGMTSRVDKKGKPIWVTPMQGHPGFPDNIFLQEKPDGTCRLLVFEAKSEKGKLAPLQKQWLDWFARVPGVVAMCVRPSQLEEVTAILKGERP